MKLSNLTTLGLISINQDYKTKEEVIISLVEKLYQAGKITNSKKFHQAVLHREKISPTGLQNGLAIPHGKDNSVKEAAFAVATLKKPLTNWESVVDGNEVEFVLLLAIPENDDQNQQISLLAELMQKMLDEAYTKKLFSSKTAAEFYNNLDNPIIKRTTTDYQKSIVAVTACAAGIAHTYMAAEALEKAGRELGVNIYVEKQGANGIEDRLTTEQLKEASAAILAVDVAVKEEYRFEHLPILKTKVATPLKDAKAVVNDALVLANNQMKKEYQGPSIEKKQGFIEVVKQSVLTGISHVVPLIVAGGMIAAICVIIARLFGLSDVLATEGSWLYVIKGLGNGLLGTLMIPVLAGYMAYSIAEKPGLAPGFAAGYCAITINGGFLCGMLGGIIAGYTVLLLKKYIPAKGSFASFISFVIYPVLSCLIVGILLLLILAKPITWVNQSLINFLGSLESGSSALLGAMLGIMVSFDLGGPVNKAAYAFCIAAMAEGVIMPYAAFASTKMVSAFAITIATRVAKKYFSDEEREIGNSTFLLGLAGITEGAIPFMMSDPIRVIFSFCTGSAVCGAIVAMFNIGLDVPGAGIFSMFLLSHTSTSLAMIVWLGAAILGAVISAGLLIITRKQKMNRK